jgi:hypothetical protein
MPDLQVDALTFGRNVQPARESKLLVDMVLVALLSKRDPKRNHVARGNVKK